MTPTTRSSLLERLRRDDAGAWQEFSDFYRPFLTRLAQRLGVAGHDVEEAVQAVVVDFYGVHKEFAYDRNKGRFRAYLQKMLFNRLRKMRRQAQRAGTAAERLPERGEEAWQRRWDEEYRDHVFRQALVRVRQEVEPLTYQAFQLYALERVEAREVASFLGISRSAVYVYKSRVLERLKVIVRELMEE
jgi:RNA polymerase sigma factor (sigma-70 family)